jgi:hypothetical protein
MKLCVPALFASVAACALPAGATVIDNGTFGNNIISVGGMFGSDAYSQSFIAPADPRLVKFGMWLVGGGDQPPLVRIDLWADDGSGNPDPNNILVEGIKVQESLNDLTRFDTETDFVLTPGQRYHVVINGFVDQESQGEYGSTWDGGLDTIPEGEARFTNDLGGAWFSLGGGDFGVYIETTGEGGCYSDLNGDTVLDLFDFLEFTNLFNAGDDVADCEDDGVLDLFDFLCYTNAFNAGC